MATVPSWFPKPPTLEDITAQSTPYWMARPQTQVAPQTSGAPASAYVEQQNPSTINVVDPKAYNPAMAAHEATHTDQFSRNHYFTDNLQALLPQGTQNAGVYDYGGVAGLQKNHPNIGSLNSEQQAQIVGDLTKAQNSLPRHPNLHQLAQWDATKAALERPISQLQAIPAAEQGISGKIDNFTHSYGLGDPMSYLKAFLGLQQPSIPVPNPVQGPPSAALGYAVPSRLVR